MAMGTQNNKIEPTPPVEESKYGGFVGFFTAKNVKYIVIGAVVLIAIILLIIFFKPSPKPNNSGDYKNQIQLKEDSIKILQLQRAIDSTAIAEKDKNIGKLEHTDSVYQVYDYLLRQKYSQTQVQHKENQVQYDKIPSTIRNLSKDSLRSQFSNY